MSTNIPTEVRRISDARSRLKSIIDQQARAQAALLSPDNFKFQTNATLAQSDLGLTDNIAIDAQGATAVSGLVPPQAPIEPDLSTLKMWMPFSNTGNQDDLALLGNTGHTRGGCTLIAGPPGNGNGLIGGSRAGNFDGSTCYVDVKDDPDIRMPATGGFSFAARIYMIEVNNQTDILGGNVKRPTIAAKKDDANNVWSIQASLSPPVITFHLKHAGTDYKIHSPNLALRTWYDLVCTYAITGNVMTMYVNNVAYTTADTNATQYATAADDLDLHIGRANYDIIAGNEYGLGGAYDPLSFQEFDFDTDTYLDTIPPFDPLCFDPVCFDMGDQIPHSTINGGFNGGIYDVRFYGVVLTATQVGNLYANKFSISAITLGQSANSGYCLSHS